jgi:hypothetical protein
MVFTKSHCFKSLRSLGFTDVEFTFNNKDELNSFLLSGAFKNPLLLLPNISFIKVPNKTDLGQIENFCKLQGHPCIIEIVIADPKTEIYWLRNFTVQFPKISFKVDPNKANYQTCAALLSGAADTS